ncbi:MAG: dethiobiotin synthase [Solirubrobacterales bacterium]
MFVTGTGTGVGKTVVAAAIARTLAGEGKQVAVFKPAVTGLDEGGEPDHTLLRRAAESAQSDDEIAPYRYGPPMSPHLAAELAGEKIEPGRLVRAAIDAASGADFLVCEGVGGLLVPLSVTGGTRAMTGEMRARASGVHAGASGAYLVRDLAVELGLPLVIAAPPGLGTINHTLLTIEAACAAGLEVERVVLTPWPEQPSRVERSNRETLTALGEVEVATLPRLDPSAQAPP